MKMEIEEKLYNQHLPTLTDSMNRKTRYKGLVTQKKFSFRLDNSNALYLDTMPNKGRYLNDLIMLDRQYDLMTLAKRHDLSKIYRL